MNFWTSGLIFPIDTLSLRNKCFIGREVLWNVLTGTRFCWARSWAAGCPSGPHHHTRLWLGRAACSAPWTSRPSSDSCQRSGPDSFCCSGSTPTAPLLRTADSALSWWILSKRYLSGYVLPASVTRRDHFTSRSVALKSSLWPSRGPECAHLPQLETRRATFAVKPERNVKHQRCDALDLCHSFLE